MKKILSALALLCSCVACVAATGYTVGDYTNVTSLQNSDLMLLQRGAAYKNIAWTQMVNSINAVVTPPATVATTNAGPPYLSWLTETNINFMQIGHSRVAYGTNIAANLFYNIQTNLAFTGRLGLSTNFARSAEVAHGRTNYNCTITISGGIATITNAGTAWGIQTDGPIYIQSTNDPTINIYTNVTVGSGSLSLSWATAHAPGTITGVTTYNGLSATYPNLMSSWWPATGRRVAVVQCMVNDLGSVYYNGKGWWASYMSNALNYMKMDGVQVCYLLEAPQANAATVVPLTVTDITRRELNDYIVQSDGLVTWIDDEQVLIDNPWDTAIMTDKLHPNTVVANVRRGQRITAKFLTGADDALRITGTGGSYTNYQPQLETRGLRVINRDGSASDTVTGRVDIANGVIISSNNLGTFSFINGQSTVTGTSLATNFALLAPQWDDIPMNYSFSVLGPTAPALTAVTNDSLIQLLAFDNGDMLYAQAQLPHRIAITNSVFPVWYMEPHVHFSTVGTLDATHSNVTWRIEWSMGDINGLFNAGTNEVTMGVTNNYTHRIANLGAITNAVPPGLSAVFRCRLTRPASGAQDYSNSHDVLLEAFDLHVPLGNTNIVGSRLSTSR